ncbi:MAG: LuxR C-terminal-related transcriptional regulator [Pseudomonadota bacterium]
MARITCRTRATGESDALPDPWDARALRGHFLDRHVGRLPARILDAVAHMLLQIDRTEQVLQVGVRLLSDTIGAGRVDAGFGSADAPAYAARVDHLRDAAERPSMVDRPLPNQHRVLQRVWYSPQPVVYDDVPNNAEVASLRQAFAAVHAKAMLAQRLATEEQGAFGLVCVDELDYGRHWQPREQETLHTFCDVFFAPILTLSRKLTAPAALTKPTPAELSAIRLAAKGMSYKQIAFELGKSVRTVETQLRNARHKVGAGNQTELVRVCEPWLRDG